MQRPMDTCECWVDKYLRHIGYTDIVFEPDGNIPPDFLVNKRIAIEVRMLNQSYDESGRVRGLDETTIPLWKTLEEVAAQIGPPRRTAKLVCFCKDSSTANRKR